MSDLAHEENVEQVGVAASIIMVLAGLAVAILPAVIQLVLINS